MRLKCTYFPVEGQWTWALWQDMDAFHLDLEFHPTKEAAKTIGLAALSLFRPLTESDYAL